ncbi:hypothetical protein AHF37_11514 [Paragonimus kellicotti]|nr:hypothetical protein AHF37_11514 [Paragonimus kellicotti]
MEHATFIGKRKQTHNRFFNFRKRLFLLLIKQDHLKLLECVYLGLSHTVIMAAISLYPERSGARSIVCFK